MRSLERKFGAICRAVAVKVAEGRRGAATDVSAAERPSQQGGKSPGGGFSALFVSRRDGRGGQIPGWQSGRVIYCVYLVPKKGSGSM